MVVLIVGIFEEIREQYFFQLFSLKTIFFRSLVESLTKVIAMGLNFYFSCLNLTTWE